MTLIIKCACRFYHVISNQKYRKPIYKWQNSLLSYQKAIDLLIRFTLFGSLGKLNFQECNTEAIISSVIHMFRLH